MPEDRTVLDHLLEGRDALQREVARLTAAIEQLDSVLGRLGGMSSGADGSADTSAPVAGEPVAAAVGAAPEPVNPPAEVQPVAAAPDATRPRTAVRKAPARKAPARTAPARSAAPRTPAGRGSAARTAPARPRGRETRPAEPPKSIRVHVLEMLAAENRDFGLAEIIDRIHEAGIQAHDDAVRSITIKLMKDGSVERVGRGQYRLARRDSDATPSAPADGFAAAPAEPSTASDEPTTYPTYAAPEAAETPDGSTGQDDAPAEREPVADEPAASYTPSLNLGQPWNS